MRDRWIAVLVAGSLERDSERDGWVVSAHSSFYQPTDDKRVSSSSSELNGNSISILASK